MTKLIGIEPKGLIGVEETVTKDKDGDLFAKNKKGLNESPLTPTTRIDKDLFYKAYNEFVDKDYSDLFEGIEPRHDYYHIKLMVYDNSIKNEKGKSSILAYNENGELTSADEAFSQMQFTHVAKIVKKGTSESLRYNVGDMVLLDVKKTMGKVPNPIFVAMQQSARQFNMPEPEAPPQGVPMYIPSIQAAYAKYYVVKPEDFDKPLHTISEFSIPEFEITGQYTLKELK